MRRVREDEGECWARGPRHRVSEMNGHEGCRRAGATRKGWRGDGDVDSMDLRERGSIRTSGP